MSHLRLSASILGCFVVLALARVGVAQTPDKKHEEAVQKIQKLLDETRIDRKLLPTELPLAKLLAALEQQLPKERRVAIRIDEKAFGAKYAEVAATPIELSQLSGRMSVLEILLFSLFTVKTPADYRIDGVEVVVTTPRQALYIASYDIRAVVTKPECLGLSGAAFRDAEPAKKALAVVQAIVGTLDRKPAEQETIEVLNGNRLVVRTTGTRHTQIAAFLQAMNRLADMHLTAQARLYEVDDAFYQRLKKVKRVPPEEFERIFLEGKQPAGDSLFDLLPKQTKILAGDEIKADSGQEAFLLGRHVVVQCGPGPAQARKGEKDRQTVLEGVSFSAHLRITSDRRYVEAKLTEKAAVVEQIMKEKVFRFTPDLEPADAEVPLMKEWTQTTSLDLPDGGSILVPVHYRPRSAQEKNRWWVLTITARIVMEEEEQAIRRQHLESVLPLVVADVLKNPRLTATRDFYGTPDDKRFTLVDSDAWSWPKEASPKVPGYQLTPAKREGKRLLAIRVEKGEGPLTVTLLNAGGSANGPAIGGCTIRYNVRQTADGSVVELAEPMDP